VHQLVADLIDAAPRGRPDARRHLFQFERFHQVVVGAQVQPLDAVGQRVEGGNQDYRHGIAGFSQLSQQRVAGHARQAAVEQHAIIVMRHQRRLRRVAPLNPVNRMLVHAQPGQDGFTERDIVFGQQDAHKKSSGKISRQYEGKT